MLINYILNVNANSIQNEKFALSSALYLQDSPFRNIIVTFVTMISFAINGPDVSVIKLYNICEKDTDTLAIGEDTDDDIDSVPYPIIAHIIWIVFAAVVSFLFITFLVSVLHAFIHLNVLSTTCKLHLKGLRTRMG